MSLCSFVKFILLKNHNCNFTTGWFIPLAFWANNSCIYFLPTFLFLLLFSTFKNSTFLNKKAFYAIFTCFKIISIKLLCYHSLVLHQPSYLDCLEYLCFNQKIVAFENPLSHYIAFYGLSTIFQSGPRQ